MITDPKIFILAFLGGIIPSLIWLYFWLKQEETRPEPKGVLTAVFILGMLAVFLVIPMQEFLQKYISSEVWKLVAWASVEELMKYLAVVIILARTNFADEPVDWAIYMITAALGFAALENTLFLIEPLSLGKTTVSLLTGQLRFLGSTLLHTISSAIIGISIGLAFFMNNFAKKIYLFIGIIFAIALHSLFNFFIIKNNGNDFLKVFVFLWISTVIVMLLFEKLRRMEVEKN